MVFLEEKEPLRDNDSFRQQTQVEHHTGRTILESLSIDMAACFSLDYMRMVCLGIMRKLLWTWIRGPLSVGCKRIRLGWRSVALISERLLPLVVHVACDFA